MHHIKNVHRVITGVMLSLIPSRQAEESDGHGHPCNNCSFHSLLRTETELSSSPQQLAEDELGSTCGCVCWRACLTIKRGVSSASSSVRCTKSVAALVCLGSAFSSRGHSSRHPSFWVSDSLFIIRRHTVASIDVNGQDLADRQRLHARVCVCVP